MVRSPSGLRQDPQHHTNSSPRVAEGKFISDLRPKPQAQRETVRPTGYSKVGYPEIVTEQILLQPVTLRKKPASLLVEAVSSQQQYRQGVSRTTEGKGPLRPLTPTVPKRTEVVLVHADLEEGLTAANPSC